MNEEYDYIVDAFTQDGENTNLEVNNLNVECITSTNNNFSLDSEGNLVVNSINSPALLNAMYPVGAIYMSVNNTSPSILFGGTWEQVKDRFLLCAGDTYVGGTTGGSATHSHTVNSHTHTSAAHTHGLSSGYAMFNPSASVAYTYSKVVTTSSWADNTRQTVSAKATSFDTTNTRGVQLGGNSNSTTPGATGAATPGTSAASSLPPYLAIFVWKRTA